MGFYNSYDYVYDYPGSSSAAAGVMAVLMVYLVIFLVWGIYALVCYIIKGLGLYTIAKRQGEDYPWLAFVPFARTYLHGELAGPIQLKKKTIKNPGIWLLALPFIQGAVMMVFYLIIWAVGFGAAFSMMSNSGSYYSYSGPGAGTIGSIVLLIILMLLVLIAFSAVSQILSVLVNHQILEKFTTKNMSIVHAVLALTIPLYEPICLLVMSRRPYNPGMEPQVGTPFMQTPPGGPVPPFMGGPAPMGPDVRPEEPNMGAPMPPMPEPRRHEAPEPSMSEPRRHEAPEPPRPESGFVPQRGLLNPSEIVKPEPPKPEIAEPEVTEPKAAEPEVKPEPPKPEVTEPKAAESEVRPEPPKPEV